MKTVYLALGTNVGDKRKNIENAISLLSKELNGIVRAKMYVSKPFGFISQDNFYNTVIKGNTLLSPEELLVFVKTIENKLGRIQRFRNGPREIDIDIVFYNNLIINKPNLIIPHPHMQRRDFVLVPLAEIEPFYMHPILKMSVKDLLSKLSSKDKFIIKSI